MGAGDGSQRDGDDVAHLAGVPIVAEIDVTPAVARTIDAGLLVPASTTSKSSCGCAARPSACSLGRRRAVPLTTVNDRHRLSRLR